MENILNELETLLTLLISLVALFISIIALYFTVRAYLLKSGHNLRCDISTCLSTVSCDDVYISNLTLENLKDRATIIFCIYLKIGRNNFLILEDFENDPLILKPYEVHHKSFDPILFYSMGFKKVKLDTLLNDNKIKKSILLSTTDGKYVVRSRTKHWRPLRKFFNNHLTFIIHPERYSFNGKQYGNNVKFLVEFTTTENKSVIELYEGDYRLKKFSDFQLTEKSLVNKENLRAFFNEQKKQKKISYLEIEIIDFQENIHRVQSKYDKDHIELEAFNFFKYKILGRFFTFLEHKKMKKENSKIRDNNLKKK